MVMIAVPTVVKLMSLVFLLAVMTLPEFFDTERPGRLRAQVAAVTQEVALIVGCGVQRPNSFKWRTPHGFESFTGQAPL
jgi:hypothetical protein